MTPTGAPPEHTTGVALEPLAQRYLEHVRFEKRLAEPGELTFEVNRERVDEIVKRCDLALYRAKSEGRDRVVAQTEEAFTTT